MLGEHLAHGVDDSEERQGAGAERCDGDLVGGVEHGRSGPTDGAGPASQRHGGKGLVVERVERPAMRHRPVEAGRGIGHPLRPGQAPCDRQAHVRRAGMGQRRAVHELHQRVDHRLRVHHDDDPVHRHVEEQVRLDDLEALVHQRGRVDRDDRSHRPGRVRQRLRQGDLAQLVTGPAAEGPSAGCEDQPPDLLGPSPLQSLCQGRVLGVHRHDLSGCGGSLHQRPADDQRLLVRQRQQAARVERGEGGGQSDGARHPVEDHVARAAGQLGGRCGADEDLGPATRRDPSGQLHLDLAGACRVGDGHLRDLVSDRLLGQQLRMGPTRGQPDDPEPVRVAGDHGQGLSADGSRAAQQHDVAAGAGRRDREAAGHAAIVLDGPTSARRPGVHRRLGPCAGHDPAPARTSD